MTTVHCILDGKQKRYTVSLDDAEAAKAHILKTIPGVEIVSAGFTVAPSPTARLMEAVPGFTSSGAPVEKKNG